jgi:hypothetical protein
LGIVFFGPTVEPNTSTEEVFLPEHPEILIANGKFQKVPFITGAVAREGLITLKGMNPFITRNLKVSDDGAL